MAKSFSVHARVRARRTAVQAYYQWLINQQPIFEIITEFERDRVELKKADKGYFRELLLGIHEYSAELDSALTPILDRHLEEISPVERAVLNIGMYELTHRPEIPWRVIINETVELAKMFGADESHKYINGVLDRAAQQIRSVKKVTQISSNKTKCP